MPNLAMAARKTDESPETSPVVDELALQHALSVVRATPDHLLKAEREAFGPEMKIKRQRVTSHNAFTLSERAVDFQTWLAADHEMNLLLATHNTVKTQADYLRRTFEAAQLVLTVFAHTKGN